MHLAPKKLALAGLVVSLALAFVNTSAGAAHQAKVATACLDETVTAFGKPTTLRFVLHGVSCSRAHALIRRYFETASIQSCRNHGTACVLELSGGWSCGLIPGGGPGFAGCATPHSKFEVFRVIRHARDAQDRLFPPASTAGPAGTGAAQASGHVVFYADVANVVPGAPPFENVPRVRPKAVLLTQDGSAILEQLRWSSWGGPVARAAGILNASNCVPDCAQGRRRYDAVQFVLSQRRPLFHRTVYSCYQLIDPKARLSDFHACLKHSSGNQYYYTPVAGRSSVTPSSEAAP